MRLLLKRLPFATRETFRKLAVWCCIAREYLFSPSLPRMKSFSEQQLGRVCVAARRRSRAHLRAIKTRKKLAAENLLDHGFKLPIPYTRLILMKIRIAVLFLYLAGCGSLNAAQDVAAREIFICQKRMWSNVHLRLYGKHYLNVSSRRVWKSENKICLHAPRVLSLARPKLRRHAPCSRFFFFF